MKTFTLTLLASLLSIIAVQAQTCCLSQDSSNAVSMKNPYVFNEVAHDDCTKIGVNLGTYTFTGITSDHPFGIDISDENELEVVSGTFEEEKDGIKFYTGTVVVHVKADFGTTSYKCSIHGYMGGQDRLVFDSECAKAPKRLLREEIFGCEKNLRLVKKMKAALGQNIKQALNKDSKITSPTTYVEKFAIGKVCKDDELRKMLAFEGQADEAPDFKGSRTVEDIQCAPNADGMQKCSDTNNGRRCM